MQLLFFLPMSWLKQFQWRIFHVTHCLQNIVKLYGPRVTCFMLLSWMIIATAYSTRLRRKNKYFLWILTSLSNKMSILKLSLFTVQYKKHLFESWRYKYKMTILKPGKSMTFAVDHNVLCANSYTIFLLYIIRDINCRISHGTGISICCILHRV